MERGQTDPEDEKIKIMNERCSGAAVLSSRRPVVWAHLAKKKNEMK